MAGFIRRILLEIVDAFEERTGLIKFMNDIARHPVPPPARETGDDDQCHQRYSNVLRYTGSMFMLMLRIWLAVIVGMVVS